MDLCNILHKDIVDEQKFVFVRNDEWKCPCEQFAPDLGYGIVGFKPRLNVDNSDGRKR